MTYNIGRALMASLLFVLTASTGLAASSQQENTNENNAKAKGTKITGCVQKGDELNGFTLKTKNGVTYELMGESVKLDEHVGHTVTVAGNKVHEKASVESQKQATEQKEANGGKYADFEVTGLSMVSESCQ
jgi:hypothetical protein